MIINGEWVRIWKVVMVSGKSQKPSANIVCNQNWIPTKFLLKTSLKCYHYFNLISKLLFAMLYFNVQYSYYIGNFLVLKAYEHNLLQFKIKDSTYLFKILKVYVQKQCQLLIPLASIQRQVDMLTK